MVPAREKRIRERDPLEARALRPRAGQVPLPPPLHPWMERGPGGEARQR